MALPPEIIKRLADKVGKDLSTPEGVYHLALDIETDTKIKLGRNTVGRLVGLIPSDVVPRATTLNAVARFLGYSNWSRLLENKPIIDEGFYPGKNLTYDMRMLPEGAVVDIRWNPDRRLSIKHLHGGVYDVLRSENGKLRKGDIISLSKLTIGLPFAAENIVRGEESLGCYAAATGSAIIEIGMDEMEKKFLDF